MQIDVLALSVPSSAAFLYAVYGYLILRALRSPESVAPASLRWGAMLAFVLQAIGIVIAMFVSGRIYFGFGLSLSVAMFAAVFTVILESYVHRVTPLMGLVLLLTAPCVLIANFFPGTLVTHWGLAFRLHIVCALLAYGFVFIAIFQALLLTGLRRQLKDPDVCMESGWISNMPNLVVMERVLFRIVGCAFIAVTLVLVFGAAATAESHGVYFVGDHKTILTWISWFVYGALLLGRRFGGWSTKRSLQCFWVATTALIVAYLVYRFLRELIFGV